MSSICSFGEFLCFICVYSHCSVLRFQTYSPEIGLFKNRLYTLACGNIIYKLYPFLQFVFENLKILFLLEFELGPQFAVRSHTSSLRSLYTYVCVCVCVCVCVHAGEVVCVHAYTLHTVMTFIIKSCVHTHG